MIVQRAIRQSDWHCYLNMHAGEYRAAFDRFSRSMEAARQHLYTAGRDLAAAGGAPETASVIERHSDLHTPAAAAELQGIFDATPSEFEAERVGVRRLAYHARLRWVASQTHSIEAELRDCIAGRRVNFETDAIALNKVAERIGVETRASKRADLADRWLDGLAACDDLRRARRRAEDEAAQELGFADYPMLRRHAATNHDPASDAPDTLLAFAHDYLDRTADDYRRRLPRFLARALPETDASRPTHADALRAERLPHLAASFPAMHLATTYQAALSSLKLRAANERITLNFKAQGDDTAATFALDPPADVRLEARGDKGGAHVYTQFFRAAGEAQRFAWSSSELRARRPEFICASGDGGSADDATRCAHAHLFQLMLHDALWLREHRHLSPDAAHDVVRDLEFVEVIQLRQAAGRVIACTLPITGSDAEQIHYAALMTEATGFVYDKRFYETDMAPDAARNSAIELRAAVFGYALRENLRTRHGSAWWSHTAARDELVDLWNTGTRYTPEELARLAISAASADAEVLTASHLETLRAADD